MGISRGETRVRVWESLSRDRLHAIIQGSNRMKSRREKREAMRELEGAFRLLLIDSLHFLNFNWKFLLFFLDKKNSSSQRDDNGFQEVEECDANGQLRDKKSLRARGRGDRLFMRVYLF